MITQISAFAKASADKQKFGMVRQCNIDPKPDELALGRLNFSERRREDRTGGLFNTLG